MSAQDDETTPDKEKINIINTNARSLLPKLNSLVDLIQENDTKIAFVTETWMQDGQGLDKLGEDVSLGSGLDLIGRGRREPAANGVYYGGTYRENFAGLLGHRYGAKYVHFRV